MPIGNGANIFNGCNVATPEGRLPLADTSRSLSISNGELPTMVRLLPMMIAAANGSRKRESGNPVRELRREATGMYSAITAGLCMSGEFSPEIAVVSNSRRFSMPCARRSSQPARRLSAPVRSSPAPRIIVAITLMTALLAKPLNSSSGATSRVNPSSISTTNATTSARMRSNRNIAIVNATSPSTSFMSVVSASAVSIRGRDSGLGIRDSKPRASTGPRHERSGCGRDGGQVYPISNSESLIPVINQVPDAVPQLLAACLEMRLRSPRWTRHVSARTGAIA